MCEGEYEGKPTQGEEKTGLTLVSGVQNEGTSWGKDGGVLGLGLSAGHRYGLC